MTAAARYYCPDSGDPLERVTGQSETRWVCTDDDCSYYIPGWGEGPGPDGEPIEVPDAIGEGPEWEWEQAQQAVREGYAAFLRGLSPSKNPYTQYGGPGQSGWSGYKKRKYVDWYRGWQLAAIRDGPCDSPEDVQERHGLTIGLPRRPSLAIYEAVYREITAEDVGPIGYHHRGTVHPTRHDAIGEAAIRGRGGSLTDPKKALAGVSVAERVRRPVIPDYGDDDE